MNEGQKNRLTGKTGNTINTFLAAYDPFNNLSVISLKDRRALIEFLELPVPFDWEKTPIGSQIVQSNQILYAGCKPPAFRVLHEPSLSFAILPQSNRCGSRSTH